MVSRFALPLAAIAAAVGCLLGVAPAAQAQVVIDFETITGMGNSPGSTVPVVSRISNQFQSSGVLFDSGANASFIAAVNLGTNHATSGVIGVGGVTNDNTLTYFGDPLFGARFVNPADGVTPFVTNFVSVRGDLQPAGGTITIRAFDIANALIGTFSANDGGGTVLSLNVPGINRVEITGQGNVAYDDFTFNAVTPGGGGAAAPEPTSAALIGATLLSLGYIRARRRR